ncbi:hypothetical protein GCM10007053_18530 [Halioglobus pacificus]|uniref:Uncharacterized protein n=1 Tax=Parahalioglobus pacificus TaxID=930806 RepID=A0A918XJ15_9GAMM|nr:hypothetical protein GCM10007053_18530 [Halioglobus pacificus]
MENGGRQCNELVASPIEKTLCVNIVGVLWQCVLKHQSIDVRLFRIIERNDLDFNSHVFKDRNFIEDKSF